MRKRHDSLNRMHFSCRVFILICKRKFATAPPQQNIFDVHTNTHLDTLAKEAEAVFNIIIKQDQ